MLYGHTISFYIDTIVTNATQDSINEACKKFDNIINQINEGLEKEVYTFEKPRMQNIKKRHTIPSKGMTPTHEEIEKWKTKLEENGYSVRKKKTPKDEKCEDLPVCCIVWNGFNRPEDIRYLINKWNELDSSTLSRYYIHYPSSPLLL